MTELPLSGGDCGSAHLQLPSCDEILISMQHMFHGAFRTPEDFPGLLRDKCLIHL